MIYYIIKYCLYTSLGVVIYFGFFMLINLLTTKRPKKDIFKGDWDSNPYIKRHLTQLAKQEKKNAARTTTEIIEDNNPFNNDFFTKGFNTTVQENFDKGALKKNLSTAVNNDAVKNVLGEEFINGILQSVNNTAQQEIVLKNDSVTITKQVTINKD